MRNGSLFQRPTWAPAMGGKGGFAGRGETWATPTMNEHTGAGQGPNKTGAPNLRTQTDRWATPDCNTSTYSNGKMGPNIREQAASWNANSAATHSPNPAGATVTGGGRKHMDQLANFVAYTPLDYLRPDPQTQDGPASLTELHGSPPPSTRRLNPYFTEWLMGWPIGHTIAEPSASSASEMASWRCKLRQRLSYLFAEWSGRLNPRRNLHGRLSKIRIKQLPEIPMTWHPSQCHNIHFPGHARQCIGPAVTEVPGMVRGARFLYNRRSRWLYRPRSLCRAATCRVIRHHHACGLCAAKGLGTSRSPWQGSPQPWWCKVHATSRDPA